MAQIEYPKTYTLFFLFATAKLRRIFSTIRAQYTRGRPAPHIHGHGQRVTTRPLQAGQPSTPSSDRYASRAVSKPCARARRPVWA